jgi:two-component system, cell cycle response regulator DivK
MKNKRILLIEDNAENQYLATFLLQAHGWEVTSAVDGPEGLRVAEALDPCLILLDIQLPGMTGYEVARSLRRLPAFASTPIVAVTSYAMPGDKERCFAEGFSGYIEKPINPDSFAQEVFSLANGAVQ